MLDPVFHALSAGRVLTPPLFRTKLEVSLTVAFYSFHGKDAEQSWPSKPSRRGRYTRELQRISRRAADDLLSPRGVSVNHDTLGHEFSDSTHARCSIICTVH